MVRSYYLKAAHAVQKRLDVFMWGFDLRELNGDDPRRDPLNVDAGQRLARAAPALRLNEHLSDAHQLRSQSRYAAACRRVREIRSSPASIAAIRMDTVSFASRTRGAKLWLLLK